MESLEVTPIDMNFNESHLSMFSSNAVTLSILKKMNDAYNYNNTMNCISINTCYVSATSVKNDEVSELSKPIDFHISRKNDI